MAIYPEPGGYFMAGRTSQKPEKRQSSFVELRYGDVRNLGILGSWR